jgi:hypothetical protein
MSSLVLHRFSYVLLTGVAPVFSQPVRTAQHWFQPLVSVLLTISESENCGFDETLQNFIYKHTVNLENDYFRIRELSVLMKPCKTLFINTP